MRSLTTLYHIARADFLERTRRHSFLFMFGMVVWLGYAAATGMIILRVPPNYVGEINSPWVGAVMTLTVTAFLGLMGFYFVKGSIARDYETRVGQIMASTPLTRPLYTLGKWLSNFAVLCIMIVILVVAGILMKLLRGTAILELWVLVAPMLIIAVPAIAIVAAVAVLFEAISWLRGGAGNVVYFFMFILVMIPALNAERYVPLLDFWGFRLIGDSVAHAAKMAYPESEGGFAFSIADVVINPRTFLFEGLNWNAVILLTRTVHLLLAVVLVIIGSFFFDRFSRMDALPRRRRKPSGVTRSPVSSGSTDKSVSPIPVINLHLTPIAATGTVGRFGTLYHAEMKLLLKGQRWWWYAIALGLVLAQFVNGLEITRIFLAVTWVWPILLLSDLGSRELHYNTHQIVFSSPRPILRQLPARWLAAFTLIAVMGSGAFLRFLVAGEVTSLLSWLGGALFIPSLALALGVMTGSSKAFEIIYVIWVYIIIQKVPALDFVGVAPDSPWHVYAFMALALYAVSALVRKRQVTASFP